ncbi:MAG: FAD-dependent monooxygenase, partial [Spirochaetia bacterium]|nr:FAD-dependent monooxygenase [Spirochaetia bacterium]
GGLTTALALTRKDIPFDIYEEAPSLKMLGAGLALGENAIRALDIVGLGRDIPWSAQALKGMRLLSADGKKLSENAALAYCIHRADLHTLLLRHIDTHHLHLGKKCVGVENLGEKITARFEGGSKAEGRLLVASDGIKSAIRQNLLPDSKPRYAGYTCFRGVTDAPAECRELDWASETWTAKGRFGIAPLRNRRVYWYACVNARETDAEKKNWKTRELLEIFGECHSPIPALIRATPDKAVIHGNIADLKPLARHVYGRILLLGDAGHATTPNLGQGACQAMEDAVVLADKLSSYPNQDEALRAYETSRLARTRKVVVLSRRVGSVAQWSKPIAVALRNAAMRLTPKFLVKRQTSFLLKPFY